MITIIIILLIFFIYIFYPKIIFEIFYVYDFYKAKLKLKKIKIGKNVFSYAQGGYGDTVIFIHGFQGEKRYWLDYAKNLKKDYRVLLLDLPAHGKSHFKNVEKFDFSFFANALEKFILKKKIGSFCLIATSLGGGIGIQYVKNFPDKVRKMILINPVGIKPKGEKFIEMVEKNKILFFPNNLKDLDLLYINLMGKALFNNFFKKWIFKDLMKNRKVFEKIFQDISKADGIENFLKDIKIPILLLQGEKDKIVPKEDFEFYKNTLLNCKAIKIDGHHIFMDEAFKKAIFCIQNFLKQNF